MLKMETFSLFQRENAAQIIARHENKSTCPAIFRHARHLTPSEVATIHHCIRECLSVVLERHQASNSNMRGNMLHCFFTISICCCAFVVHVDSK